MKTLRTAALLIVAALALCGSASAQGMGASLVPPSSATDIAAQSGSWQEASTWTDGTVPGDAEQVLIPAGVTVTNHATTADVRWCLVAGVLDCCDHCDVEFNIDTTFVAMGGALRLGTLGMPATGKVVYEFPPGPFLPGDMTKLSRGIINHGEFTVCGNEKTHADEVVAELLAGSTTLQLKNVPYGWQVGDRIAIAGTYSSTSSKYQTEERTITAINGQFVSWSEPLLYRHFRWRDDLPFHCANLSRNIVIRSRDTSTIANRGHIMNMAVMNQFYCLIEGCGRTDKSVEVTDPRMDLHGQMVNGSDANPRARYADHDHKVGPLSPPLFRRGIVIDGSPGWGGLIHASNVIYEDCIAVRCFGFGFGTEEGQERGAFRRCLSFLNHGLGDTITSTDADHGIRLAADWGKDGSGFWLQGGLVEVSDCVAFDNSGRGFALFNQTMNSYPVYGQGTNQIPAHLQYPIEHHGTLLGIEYDGRASTPSSTVPQRVFARNTAYNNKIGVQGWNGPTHNGSSQLMWPPTVRGSITDLTLWGRGGMLHLEYMRQANVDGLRIVGVNNVHDPIGRGPAVYMRGAEVTVKRWTIEDRSGMHFAVVGATDPGGIPAKNIVIEGATVNADGSVTIH